MIGIKHLIQQLPCFSMLSPTQLDELAALMKEKTFSAGKKIVIEEALIDSIFIIARGEAEVTKKLGKKTAWLAVLHTGDAIGLNDAGFFSDTGLRTATVTALTEVLAFKLELADLHAFLKKHPELQTAMQQAAKQMLRFKLIKQALPFSKLSHDHLMKLENKVEELHLKAGTLIFKKGESGDRCYLIVKGKVEILDSDPSFSGTAHRLALLKFPALFGEATLLTHTPRNASARVVEDCHLFLIHYKDLSELLATEKETAELFMTLMLERSKPIQSDNVIVHERTALDGQPVMILKNSEKGTYFKLSSEGWFLWEKMDGKHTVQELTLAFSKKFHVFSPERVTSLIAKLAEAGFIENIAREKTFSKTEPPWIKAIYLIRKVLETRFAIGDADRWLTNLYNKAAYVLFTRAGSLFCGLLAICGFAAFIWSFPKAVLLFSSIENAWILFILLIPFLMAGAFLHELGHGLATKSFGHEVHYMGIGWYWLSPIAFTDTSDMWLSGRWPRVIVNLAGIFSDLLVASILSLLFFVVSNVYAKAFVWLLALWNYLDAFRHLNPLQELDGYFVMMDLFERPHLRQSSVEWLLKKRKIKDHLPEMTYWIACVIFIILLGLLTFFIQNFVFKIFHIQPGNIFVSLALPILVALISTLGVIADIRQAEAG